MSPISRSRISVIASPNRVKNGTRSTPAKRARKLDVAPQRTGAARRPPRSISVAVKLSCHDASPKALSAPLLCHRPCPACPYATQTGIAPHLPYPTLVLWRSLAREGSGKNRLKIFAREVLTDQRIPEGDVCNKRNHDPLQQIGHRLPFEEDGTGSVSCHSGFVLHLCHFLNQEDLMEREAMVQNS